MLLTLTLEHCRPAPLEMLKWGWVQFITTFLVVRWLLKRLERTIFGMSVVERRVLSELVRWGYSF